MAPMFPMMKVSPVSRRLSGRFHACRFLFALPLAAGLMTAAMPAQAQVYKCKVDGKVSYQAMPCRGEVEGELKLAQDDGVGREGAALRKLWTGLKAGMSVAEVKKQRSGLMVPERPSRLVNGAEGLLEKDMKLAGALFKVKYYFLDGGYYQVMVTTDNPWLREDDEIRALYGKLQPQVQKMLGKASSEEPLEMRNIGLWGRTEWTDADGNLKTWVFITPGPPGQSMLTVGHRPDGVAAFKDLRQLRKP